MATNEGAADVLQITFPASYVVEKNMFGGIAVMLHCHMCVGSSRTPHGKKSARPV